MQSAINHLNTPSRDEAEAYLATASGDELRAAILLANDRNLIAGEVEAPDDAEIHHALFLLRKAMGLEAPSYDSTRVKLRDRAA
jgi:hypothetical protein